MKTLRHWCERRELWRLCVFVLGLTAAFDSGSANAAESPSGEAAAVRETASAQSAGQDVLVLNTGESLKGMFLDEALSLRTAYGQLILKREWLRNVRLLPGDHGLFTALTSNGNKFTGFLETETLRLKTKSGHATEVRRERVAELNLSSSTNSIALDSKSSWIKLKNGDVLSGRITPDPLSSELQSEGSRTPNTKAGSEGLTNDYYTVELEWGQKVQIFAENVVSVDRSRLDDLANSADIKVGPPHLSPSLEGLIWIAPGSFVMGGPYNEQGRDPDEGPQTKVVISQGFWMAKHEVTQAEYEKVTGTNPSLTTDDPKKPVDRVNWFEAVDYCGKLTQLHQSAGLLPEGYAYRLPTEAEWEYACRAGTTTRYSHGDDLNDSQLADFAWFTRNSDFATHPVGTRKPNPWGLYDMHGNVWEWCLNRWEGTLPGAVFTHTVGAQVGGLRVTRGGSWLYEAKAARCANRDDYDASNRCSDIGFRVVLAPKKPQP